MKNENSLFSRTNALLLFVIALASALIVPALFQDGMFADGVLYAAVAKNTAIGSGTFWHPHFMSSMHDHFHEQPPLGLFLQSLFFHVFSGIYPERFYDLLIALIDGWLIVKIWRNYFSGQTEIQKNSFWPLLLFFISPLVFWAFTNNILEITMAAFALAATDSLITALIHQRKTVLHLTLATIWIICASMCKGPQGIFPVVFPAILWICGKQVSFKKALLASLAITGGIVLFYALILQSESIREAYTSWYASRILVTFAGTHNTSGSHFAMLYDLLLDLLPLLGLSAIIFLLGKKAANSNGFFAWKKGHAFFLLALAGSLPLLITREQRAFYLMTSLPFYALSIAFYTAPYISALLQKTNAQAKSWKITGMISLVLIIAALIITVKIAGTPKRDAGLLHDLRISAKMIGDGKSVACDQATYTNWAAVNYFQRYEDIEINPDTSIAGTRYYISTTPSGPEGWKEVKFDRQFFYLFERP